MKNRYLIFAGFDNDYDRAGGVSDFQKAEDDLEKAKESAKELHKHFHWIEVFDVDSLKIVYQIDNYEHKLSE